MGKLDCFKRAKLTDQANEFERLVRLGMPETEAARVIGDRYFVTRHRELSTELNNLKKKANIQEDEPLLPKIDISTSRAAFNQAYDEYASNPNEENETKLGQAIQTYTQAAKPSKANSYTNPWAKQIRDLSSIEEVDDSFMDKARKLINQLEPEDNETKQELTKLLNESATGKKDALIAALNKSAGVPKKITSSEKVLLADQIRNFARGMREGRLDEQTDRKALLTSIRAMMAKVKMPEKVMKSILAKLNNVNLKNPSKVLEIIDYVGQSLENVKKATRIYNIQTIQRSVKKKFKKRFPKEQHEAISAFLKVDPSQISNLDNYESVLVNMYGHMQPITSNKYMEPPRLSDIESLAEEGQREMRERQEAREEEANMFMDFGKEVSDYVNGLSDVELTDADKIAQAKDIMSDMVMEELPNLPPVKEGELYGEIYDTIKQATKERLEQMTPEVLRDFKRALDQLKVNNSYTQFQEAAMSLQTIIDSEMVPKLERELGSRSVTWSTFSTGVNNLFWGNLKKAALWRAFTGIQPYLSAETVASDLHMDLMTKIQKLKDSIEYSGPLHKISAKTVGLLGLSDPYIELESQENRALAKTYSELIQRELSVADESEAFVNAKANIETSIETMAVDNPEGAAIKQAAYDRFKDAQTRQEAMRIMEQTSPQVYKWVHGLVDIFKDLRTVAKEATEVIWGERFDEIENYLPLGTKSSRSAPTLDDQNKRPDNLFNAPYKAGSLEARELRLGKGQYRTNEFITDLIRTSNEVYQNRYTSLPFIKMRKFLELDRANNYKWTGSADNHKAYFEFLKNKVVEPAQDISENERLMKNIANSISRVAYTAVLGGVLGYVKQYGGGITRAMFDFGTQGDLGLVFGNGAKSEGAKKVRSSHTIGGRLKRLAGITTNLETENKITDTESKRFKRAVESVEEGTVGISNIAVGMSFGRGDANLAERVWSASYLQSLKKDGIDVSNTDDAFWQNEYELRNEPTRKAAAAYAETYIGQNLLHSSGKEQARVFRSMGTFMRLVLPLMQYRVNLSDRIANNIGIMMRSAAGTENRLAATRSLTADMVEIVTFDIALRAWIIHPLTDLFAAMWIEYMTGLDVEDDDEREEKKQLFRDRFMYLNTVKDAIPVPMFPFIDNFAAGGIAAAGNQLSYELQKEEDESYSEWKERNQGETFPAFTEAPNDNIGIVGILMSKFDDWDVKGDELTYTAMNGDKRTILLSDAERGALSWNWLKTIATFVGFAELEKAIKAGEQEALRQAKDANKN